MTEGDFSENDLQRLRELSLAFLKAHEASANAPPGEDGLEQRRDAYDKMRVWATTSKAGLLKTASYFWAHRGEPADKGGITILVGLLSQLRDDYIRHVIQENSELTRYDSSYQEAAQLDQEEQFWKTWQPLFMLADAYKEGAFESPPPGIGRVEFELKKREWSLR
jgi:hypothetical protein